MIQNFHQDYLQLPLCVDGYLVDSFYPSYLKMFLLRVEQRRRTFIRPRLTTLLYLLALHSNRYHTLSTLLKISADAPVV